MHYIILVLLKGILAKPCLSLQTCGHPCGRLLATMMQMLLPQLYNNMNKVKRHLKKILQRLKTQSYQKTAG